MNPSQPPRTSAELRLPGGPSAPVRARAAVSAHCAEHLDEERLGDLLVLTSEVVTNAVIHGGAGAGQELKLRLAQDRRAVRVTVTDTHPERAPRVVPPDPTEPGGLGLMLVDLLSERWGVERADTGTKEVWFEFLLTGRPLAPEPAQPSWVECPGCGLRLYTADAWITLERCPRCRAQVQRSSPWGTS